MEAGRTMSPSPACLDRYTGTRFCRLTTRTRGAIAGIHHEASHPPSSMAVVGAMCALEITTAKPEDSSTFPCQATSFLPCRPFIQPAGGVGEGRGVGSGMVAHTREEDQQSIRGSSDQQPSWREKREKRYLLFRTPRASFAVAAGRGEEWYLGGLCCQVAYAQC